MEKIDTMASNIARILLETKAVQFSPKEYFTYSSGIKSPIYCDNRSILGYPNQRKYISEAFVECITADIDIIAGTATAGIPWASFVAEKKHLPMCYVRSAPKAHGKNKQVEGANIEGKNIALIEDLLSTGGSVATAYKALHNEGAKTVSIYAIFSYELLSVTETLTDATYTALCSLSTLLHVAQEMNVLSTDEIETVLRWQKNPKAFI